MDMISMQKDYLWILKILDSCLSVEQIDTCEKLFDNFINKWFFDLSDERRLTFTSNFYRNKTNKTVFLKKTN